MKTIITFLTLLSWNFLFGQTDTTSCLYFDGIDDRITANSEILDNIGSCNFTFEAWLQIDPSASAINVPVFSNRSISSSNITGVLFFIHGGNNLALQIIGNPGAFTTYLFTNNGSYGASLKNGDCHHVAISRKSDLLSFYIDGNLIGTKTLTSYKTVAGNTQMLIGRDIYDNKSFKGHISEVKIWNTARSAQEIAKDMVENVPQNKQKLSAYWRMNEGESQTITDYSDNNYDVFLGTSTAIENIDPTPGQFCCNRSALSDCQVSIIHNENETYSSGVFKAGVKIQSKAKVDNVEYSAGNIISLNSGFSGGNGFSAYIEGCQTESINPLILDELLNKAVVSNSNISFKWVNLLDPSNSNLNYSLTILDGNRTQDLQQALVANNIFLSDNFNLPYANLQSKAYNNLNLIPFNYYFWNVSAIDNTGVPNESEWFIFQYNPVPGAKFYEISCEADCQILSSNSFDINTQNIWTNEGIFAANFYEDSLSCDNNGFARMNVENSLLTIFGNTIIINSNTAIGRATTNTLNQSSYYKMSFCYRKNTNDDIRINAFAYNNNAQPIEARADMAYIGYSGYLPNTNNNWVEYSFTTWEANKNFDNILIVAEAAKSDEFTIDAFVDIDNICIGEMDSLERLPDYDFGLDCCGEITYPNWLNDLINNHGAIVTETRDSVNLGSEFDLYGHKYDTTVDTWFGIDTPYQHSIGGGRLEDFAKCDSFYNAVDTFGIIDSTIINTILTYVDPIIEAEEPISIFTANDLEPIAPLSTPNFDCLYFDGIDDCVKINSSLFNNIASNDFTIELTIDADQFQNSNSPVLFSTWKAVPAFPGSSFTDYYGFEIFLYDDPGSTIKPMAFRRNLGSLQNINYPQTPIYFIQNNGGIDLLDNICHQIAISKANDQVNFYIDGTFISSFSTDPLGQTPFSLASGNLPLVGKSTNGNNAFKGVISDLRIWDKARTSTEISTNYLNKRFSYNADNYSLVANFELTDIKTQEFHNNAFNSNTAFLGTDATIESEDPTTITNCCKSCENDGLDNDKPFGGRDIIYVHGLRLGHLMLPFDNFFPKYLGKWPQNKEDFYVGDYKEGAIEEVWEDHIIRELGSIDNPTNSYLVAPYPCDQRMSYGINAIIHQIKNAIETGRGVVWADYSNRQYICPEFGKNGIVIVSHSTGGLVASTLLGMGPMSDDPSYLLHNVIVANYGNFKPITDKVHAHVAFNPAVNGSPLARAALVVSAGVGNATAWVNAQFENLFPSAGANWATALAPQYAYNSILVDLHPTVSYVIGNLTYSNATTQTVTAASSYLGYPANKWFKQALFTKAIIPGLDDGVLMIDCQCARKKDNEPLLSPSKYATIPNPFMKNFDFGNQALLKATGQYIEQGARPFVIEPPFLNASCVGDKTISGMLTWGIGERNPPRWDNHYSMLQSSAYHYDAWDINVSGIDYINGELGSGIPMYEESSVVTNASIYDVVPGTNTHLVNPDFQNISDISRKERWLNINLGFTTIRILIWRRTYSLCNGLENNDNVSYMYDFVLRNP